MPNTRHSTTWRGYKHDRSTYKVGNVDIGTVRKEQDLVVTSRANLNVSEQCGTAALRPNMAFGLIQRNIINKEEIIIPLYKSVVRSYLECCIQGWRLYCRKDIAILERFDNDNCIETTIVWK